MQTNRMVFFMGFRPLLQMLPAGDDEEFREEDDSPCKVRCAEIEDFPRFQMAGITA